jgi:hypothetical protein
MVPASGKGSSGVGMMGDEGLCTAGGCWVAAGTELCEVKLVGKLLRPGLVVVCPAGGGGLTGSCGGRGRETTEASSVTEVAAQDGLRGV